MFFLPSPHQEKAVRTKIIMPFVCGGAGGIGQTDENFASFFSVTFLPTIVYILSINIGCLLISYPAAGALVICPSLWHYERSQLMRPAVLWIPESLCRVTVKDG